MFKRMYDYFQFEIVAWHFNVTSSVSIFDKDKGRKLGYDMLYLAAICRNRLVEMVEVVYSLKKIENMIFNQVRRTKVMTRALEMIPLAPSSSGMHVPRAIFVDLEPTDIDEVGNRRADIRNSENEIHVVMAISVISVSSDSAKESVGIPAGQIPTVSPIIPPSLDYTPASPEYSPASDTETDPSEDPSSDHIPPLPATSPFLSSTDDSSDTSGALRRRVMILAPRQPIPHGRPYRYHPNGPVNMMTARKRVGPLPTHFLVVRHSVDYSSSDHFTLDDSSRDSSSSSSSETSSDSPSDDLSDSSSSHSSSDHSLPALPSSMRSSYHLCLLVPSIPRSSTAGERPSHSFVAGPSRKRSRSPTTSVPILSPTPRALSSARADLLPPPKRIRSSDFVTDLEGCLDESSESSIPRETSLRDDVVVRSSDEPHLEHDIDLEIQVEVDECIAYADALRARGIDARVVVEVVDREEIETDDIPEPAQEEGAVEVTYETLRDMVQRFQDHTVTPLFLQIAAEANLGYYFKGELNLEAKGGYVIWLGHVGGL
ncbi:hypothetical protein Tco_1192481 [Tanacetum coccineum]